MDKTLRFRGALAVVVGLLAVARAVTGADGAPLPVGSAVASCLATTTAGGVVTEERSPLIDVDDVAVNHSCVTGSSRSRGFAA